MKKTSKQKVKKTKGLVKAFAWFVYLTYLLGVVATLLGFIGVVGYFSYDIIKALGLSKAAITFGAATAIVLLGMLLLKGIQKLFDWSFKVLKDS